MKLDTPVTLKHLLYALGAIIVYKAYAAYELVYRISDWITYMSQGHTRVAIRRNSTKPSAIRWSIEV